MQKHEAEVIRKSISMFAFRLLCYKMLAASLLLSSIPQTSRAQSRLSLQWNPGPQAEATIPGWLFSAGITLVDYDMPASFTSRSPSFSLMAEKGVLPYLLIGAYGGYRKVRVSSRDSQQDDIRAGLRVTLLAFPLLAGFSDKDIRVKGLEPYLAVHAGIDHTRINVFGAKSNSTGFHFAVVAGSRYYFTEHIAAFAELGYGIFGLFNLGLSVRLGDPARP
jgi:hypothetical protein